MFSVHRAGQIAHPMPIGRVRMRKTSEARRIFREHTFYLQKKKRPLDLSIFTQIGKILKVDANPKYYREHRRI